MFVATYVYTLCQVEVVKGRHLRMLSLKDQAVSSACSEDEARINNECSTVLHKWSGM